MNLSAISRYRKTHINLESKRERGREKDVCLRLNISLRVGFYCGDEFYFRHKINLREGRAGDIISNGGKKWPSNGAVNAPFDQNKCPVRPSHRAARSIALYLQGKISFLRFSFHTQLTPNREETGRNIFRTLCRVLFTRVCVLVLAVRCQKCDR